MTPSTALRCLAWAAATSTAAPACPAQSVRPDFVAPPPRVTQPPHAIDRGGPVNLRPKWERGQQIRYIMTIDSAFDALSPLPDLNEPQRGSPPPATPDKTRLTHELGIVLRVKDAVADGPTTVELTIETVKASLDAGGDRSDFDSTRPAPPNGAASGRQPDALDLTSEPFEAMCRAIVGDTQTLTIDPDGRITAVSGGSGLAGLAQLGGNPGAANAPALIQSIVSTGTTRPAATVGESWSTRTDLGTGPLGPVAFTTTYRLATHRAGTARVAFSGRAEPASLAQSPPGLIALAGASTTGTYDWDTARGQLAELSSEQRLDFQVAGPLPPRPAGDSARPRTLSSIQKVHVQRQPAQAPPHPR